MEANSKKHRFRKGRSATFSIDGFNITIVANEDGESSTRPQASFARSKSQSALWNAITAGMGIKGKEQKAPPNDTRSPEEILADDLPTADEPDVTEKTAISGCETEHGFSLSARLLPLFDWWCYSSLPLVWRARQCALIPDCAALPSTSRCCGGAMARLQDPCAHTGEK
ncbi:calcium/calmodulin-dependent 3',5'-cyclic nucleotide phosphodiesterase 1C isoform X2 [Perca flavescens]|uniref:calcium/calmodulin-dependent 3',5'-cyclic nucleotide phosphodiesterase 1C isoform X2 n=1 Tax=Perca flavescens TaxID=8167 RepID=UPI00106DF7E7|nr:calcium/calmodulin-dependent 3',5'-cyclic nucleotide phosphodiesterase 1C-like isoform X2 [Perca flavescens]